MLVTKKIALRAGGKPDKEVVKKDTTHLQTIDLFWRLFT